MSALEDEGGAAPRPAAWEEQTPAGAMWQEHPPWRAVESPTAVSHPHVRAEILPMPVAGIIMVVLAWASVALAVTGPAGVLAGLGSLWARRRFLDMERAQPGHRGGRMASWLGVVAVVGAAVGALATLILLGFAVWVDAT